MKEGDIRFAKLLVLVCGLVPLTLLVWDQAHHRLGANPQNFVILTTGMMTLLFLTLTMAVTPVRKVFGLNWVIQLRRMLGLYAFFYGCLHFLCFYSLDRAFSISSTLHEIVVRKYIWFGMTVQHGANGERDGADVSQQVSACARNLRGRKDQAPPHINAVIPAMSAEPSPL
jgi:DMSO/TMAO reductase YedYZ heme-binding membrane subunit